MTQVFVSSTVFDLIDLRAELEQHLREMGLTPVMSDRPTASFDVSLPTNSIETCLANLRASDMVIVILSQRYGPSLGPNGFDDISATHLEYREATITGKPVYFYVRDRLEGEFNLWRKNRHLPSQDKIQLPWAAQRDAPRLFEFLEERRKLDSDADTSNWYSVFSNSFDLKRLVSRDLGLRAEKANLVRVLASGDIPATAISLAHENGGRITYPLSLNVENCGARAILDLWGKVYTRGIERRFGYEFHFPWLPAGKRQSFTIPDDEYNHPEQFEEVRLWYQLTEGHHCVDRFKIEVTDPDDEPSDGEPRLWFEATLKSRQFAPRDEASSKLQIVDSREFLEH